MPALSSRPPARPADPTGGAAPVLRLEGVERSFREGTHLRSVLRGVELDVHRGEFVALLGPSGSGKSTLLNLIAGIDTPDRGTVEVDGTPLHALSERERTLVRRDRMGFIFQFFHLLPTLTVGENLLLSLELAGRVTEATRARAWKLLADVGLAGRERSWPDRLSGGEQQRVAIARALVHEPALVLADEPTGNLDRDTGDRVLDLLCNLVRDTGATLVMVTHAREAARRADRVLELRDGVLVETLTSGTAAAGLDSVEPEPASR